jgi:hypothetical protein
MQAIARNVRTSEQTERHLWQGCQQKKETQVAAGLLAIEGTPAIGDIGSAPYWQNTFNLRKYDCIG